MPCFPQAAGGACLSGEMFCRAGAWSECETVEGAGAVTAPLITGPSACDSCSPTCARTTDAPNDADLTADNSDGDLVYDPDEGGITLPGRGEVIIPPCAEEAAGLPPGGTYEEFCSNSGSLILEADTGTPDPNEEVCSQELAANTFRAALCSCEDLAGRNALSTSSFNSNGDPSDNHQAHVWTNGRYLLNRSVTIQGDLVAAGMGSHGDGSVSVSRSLRFGGPLTNGSHTTGTYAGDPAYVNGNVTGGLTVNGGAGTLFVPGGSNVSGASANVMNQAVSVDAPCPCDPADIIDITSFIASTRGALNDNDRIGLDPDDYNPIGNSSLTLPCGRYYLSGIDAGRFNLTLEGRTALFIDGDFTTSSSLDIDLPNEESEVDVFVAGAFDSDASVQLGDSNRPARARFYVGGSDPITFSANSRFYGNFYAPQADVSFGGSVEVRGSMFVNSVSGNSRLDITYDEAVLDTSGCPEPAEGRYWRDIDAVSFCGSDDEIRPDWGSLVWDADIPDGQEIVFEVRTAGTEADLDVATGVSFSASAQESPLNLGDLLIAAGEVNQLPFLRVTAYLQSDGSNAPLLRSFDIEFECGFGTSGVSSPEDFTCSGSPPICESVCQIEVCDDGVDNDCDGNVDCADAGSCGTSEACCLGEICGDGINNDCDGDVDFYDSECACTAEICDDGLDNDGDGDADCADDAACPATTSCGPGGQFCNAMAVCECPAGGISEISCVDGVDNDCDGDTDCSDIDCISDIACVPPESCNNGADDNLDGLTDCDDTASCPDGVTCGDFGLECLASACVCPGGATETDCIGGVDDDCDGDTDCGDADCAMDDACVPPEVCGNGVDDNGDGLVDCAETRFCALGATCGPNGLVCDLGLACICPFGEAVEVSCADGIDNDCNGFTDCADGACGCTAEVCNNMVDDNLNGDIDCDDAACLLQPCRPNGEICNGAGMGGCECPFGEDAGEVSCDDGIDNDCDGLADCADVDCAGGCPCVALASETSCTDGVDNDCDGDLDCGDADCFGTSCGANGVVCNGAGMGACACPFGEDAGEVSCGDGVDNDCDGDIDCADADCGGVCPCAAGPTETNCADGLDGDCDGSVDCADADCRTAPACCSASETSCADGVDDDCDGDIDCDDADCAGVGACATLCNGATCNCANATCNLGCTSGTCAMDCQPSATCNIQGDGFTEIELTCEGGSTCVIEAENGNRIDGSTICRDRGTSCTFDCVNMASCEPSCRNGAECLMECRGTPTCGWTRCNGGSRTCPGGIVVCNRACP